MEPNPFQQPSSNPNVKLAIVLLNGVGLLFALLTSCSSLFAFDSPNAKRDPKVWLIVAGTLSVPVVVLLMNSAAWWLYLRGNQKTALYLSMVVPVLALLFCGSCAGMFLLLG